MFWSAGFSGIIVLAVLAGIVNGECEADNHVNGCSIPFDAPVAYKTDFVQACNRHDVCYYCVSTFTCAGYLKVPLELNVIFFKTGKSYFRFSNFSDHLKIKSRRIAKSAKQSKINESLRTRFNICKLTQF